MISRYSGALAELGAVFERIDDAAVEDAVAVIASAQRIALYGVGREGLQIKGLAMRLFHLGLKVSVVGEMTTPPLGAGDLLIVSAGPGYLSTVASLMETASAANVKTLCVTAQPDASCPQAADHVLTIPAQTMANDSGPDQSILPMGSVFEGAQFVLFEIMVLKLRDKLGIDAAQMRSNHTNLE